MKKIKLLYGAYGANTHHGEMSYRCPNAEFIGAAEVAGWDLEFRGVADIVPNKKKTLDVALWGITEECEAALDRFEGFPSLYIKKRIRTIYRGEEYYVLYYVMNPDSYRGRSIAPPPKSYYNCLYFGYQDCGLPHTQLFSADGRAHRKQTGFKNMSSSWG